MAKQQQKTNLFRKEFIFFWVAIFISIVVSMLAFFYFSLLWFVVVIFLFATLVGGALFYGLSFVDFQKKGNSDALRADKVAESVSDAVIAYNRDFKIIAWNRVAEETFGINKPDIIGQTISPEKMSEPSFKNLVQVIFPSLAPFVSKRSAPGEYPQIMDISFPDPSLELTVSTDRIVDEDGKLIGFLKVIKNRTREVGLLRSKSEFITVAAHQLRTPLTALHWTFETLAKNQATKGEDKELIENGLLASNKVLRIVNDLLDVSKIESGKFGYEFKKIDIRDFMDELLRNADLAAKEFGISLYFDRPQNPIFITADPEKLGIAFSNIIDNAIKYNVKNGQVVVKIESYPNKPYIQISIKDTGIGMSTEALAKLFSKFFREESAIKESTDGSGLGLYIAKNIVLRHGGNISVDSALGRGSVFYIVLPTDPSLIPPKEVAIV